MDTQEEALTRTAYHEAGHIVIGHILGLEHSHVSIVPNGNVLGEARLARPLAWPRGARARQTFADNHATMSYAGAAAERHRFGSITGSDADDRAHAEALILTRSHHRPCPSARDRLVTKVGRKLEARATLLVQQHWGGIDRVARALIASRALTTDDLRPLLKDTEELSDWAITSFVVAGSWVTVWRTRLRIPIYCRSGPQQTR